MLESLLGKPLLMLTFLNSCYAGPQAIFGLKVLHMTFYILSKPENIAKLRRYKTTITTPGVTTFVLRTLFGMSAEAVNMYTKDDSGISHIPKPDSHVPFHNRIDHLTHVNFRKHLLGDGLPQFFQAFSSCLSARFLSLNISYEWKQYPDIMQFWLYPLTYSLNEALAGPILHCVSPNFTDNLLRYYPYVHPIMMSLPKWCIPESYRLRDSLIQDVRRWHAVARARFQESDIAADGTDPWWGSAFMRERQKIIGNVDNWDCNDMASSDFGIFWG